MNLSSESVIWLLDKYVWFAEWPREVSFEWIALPAEDREWIWHWDHFSKLPLLEEDR